jgi:hypothetical protein
MHFQKVSQLNRKREGTIRHKVQAFRNDRFPKIPRDCGTTTLDAEKASMRQPLDVRFFLPNAGPDLVIPSV